MPSTRKWQSIDHSMPPMTQGRIRCTRPIRPRQSTYLRACLSHRKARSSNSSVRTGKYLRGVQPTCQVFPGNSPSTLSNCFQMQSQSSKRCVESPVQSEPQSNPKSTGYSQQDSLGKSRNHNGWPTLYSRKRSIQTSFGCAWILQH